MLFRSMGLAGRFMKPANDLISAGKLTGLSAKKATVAAWGKELAVQAAAGAGGEFAAQKATGENKPAEVIMEALGELTSGPADVYSSMQEARQIEDEAARRKRILDEIKIEPPVEPPPPAPPEVTPQPGPTTPPAAPTAGEPTIGEIEPIPGKAEPRKPGGLGFTHVVGDMVSISSPRLGTLTNRVSLCENIAPWTFGASALMRNLAQRGLLK